MTLDCPQIGFERVQAVFPGGSERGDPRIQLGEGRDLELIEAPLGHRPGLDDARLAQGPQVLRNLRLPESKALGDLADRGRPIPQKFDDAKAVRLRQGA
jgi:hypothetical protein